MSEDRPRVFVVYEHGDDGEPFGSAHLRLLRPLSHPVVRGALDVTIGRDYEGAPADLVVVDRLWCPDVSGETVGRLVDAVRGAGARLVHALDDNFVDLVVERPDWATPDRVAALEALMGAADGLMVTTEPLAARYRAQQPNIAVVPNALDERLLADGRLTRSLRRMNPLRRGPVVIGYMGTYTHDDDLAMIAPALRSVHERFGDRIYLQFLGVFARSDTYEALRGIPIHVVHPEPAQAVYPAFLPWFCNSFQWDIALSPLRDTPFNRCKSDIKFLDYAALGAAGVFSRVPAYAGTVRHGETGMLVDNTPAAWSEAIGALVADGGQRRRIAREADRYLNQERVLAVTAARWVEALRGLRRGPARGRR